MSDVFVSYKAEDRGRIEPLVGALEAEGLSVWWDARVGGGEAWRETIAEQLDAANCVIVAWSRRSTGPEGRFVRDEASRAQRRGTYLPLSIERVEPPLGFGEVQALSLIGWKGDPSDPHYRAVSACVHSMLGREPVGTTSAGAGRSVDRRAVLVGGAVVAAAGAATGGWLLLRPSGARADTVAVLPFANLSGDPTQNYFSDGMAEEVRSALAGLGGVEVVARTSSEMLRNTDAITAAHRLSVANVVTGSVRRSPNTVRVSAQLVDGKNGLERWSQTFDRPFGDVLQVQTDIAANVARALSLELGSHSNVRQTLGGTTNAQAQDLVLQATAAEGDDSSEGLLRRIALLNRAIQLDPGYAEAHARKGLQQSLWANSWAPNADKKDRVDEEAIQSVRQAIAIAPAMPLGYASLGLIYRNQLAMRASLDAFQRAVDLPGADAFALFNYALVLAQLRRQNDALSMIERAINVDPLNSITRMIKAWILFFGRSYPAAIEAGRQALAIAPKNNRARGLVGSSFLFLGRMGEAEHEFRQMPADDYRRLVGEGSIAARAGRKADALKAIRAIEKSYGDATNYQYAQIYGQLGMIDQGISALEAAWSKRDSGLGAMLVDPFVEPLRRDPRFLAIAKRIFV